MGIGPRSPSPAWSRIAAMHAVRVTCSSATAAEEVGGVAGKRTRCLFAAAGPGTSPDSPPTGCPSRRYRRVRLPPRRLSPHQSRGQAVAPPGGPDHPQRALPSSSAIPLAAITQGRHALSGDCPHSIGMAGYPRSLLTVAHSAHPLHFLEQARPDQIEGLSLPIIQGPPHCGPQCQQRRLQRPRVRLRQRRLDLRQRQRWLA